MRFSAICALALLGTLACSQPEARTAAELESERIARSLMAALESADTILISELFWPQASYDDFANQISHQGVEEIVGYVTSSHVWGDDVFMNVGTVHTSPSTAVVEWVFSAVHRRPIPGVDAEPAGAEVVLNGVTVLELEGARIIRAADYLDTTPMWLQLGGRVELPGGGRIEMESGGR